MRRHAQTGFILSHGQIRSNILIPRYYDPRIGEDLSRLNKEFDLLSIDTLIEQGRLEHSHGKYIPKIHYGTGPFPYIRTSDIANWELRASPKHGVSKEVYDEYHSELDVRPLDILFVHEGTYLIGSSALVTAYDGPMLYQHHLAKFRVTPKAGFTPYYFLAALGSPLVQRQIRSKQFSADIIDSVVGRLGEIVVPIPRDNKFHAAVSSAVESAIEGRAISRERLSHFFSALDGWLSNSGRRSLDEALKWYPKPDEYAGRPTFLGAKNKFQAFVKRSSEIRSDILIPKYYDPRLLERMKDFEAKCDLKSIEELIAEKSLSLDSGDEIGKLSYGTGSIPFVRTSDLGTFELKADAKHGVSRDIYQQYASGQNVLPNDILIVRDGTYLVGTSTVIFEEDGDLLYCGGINKIHALKPELYSPFLIFSLLNISFVKEQMRRKQFTRDIIDTLGHRLREVVLPIPRDVGIRREIAAHVESLCRNRVVSRVALNTSVQGLFG